MRSWARFITKSMNTKKCHICKETKDISAFGKDSTTKSKLSARCKECSRKICSNYYNKNKEIQKEKKKEYREKVGKEYFAERSLINKYGITLKERNEILVNQNHKCDICGIDEVEAVKSKLFVDHNHTTNKVRALLCHNCNTLIGHCKESEDILLKAIQYLRKHKE